MSVLVDDPAKAVAFYTAVLGSVERNEGRYACHRLDPRPLARIVERWTERGRRPR
jgi:hypothetical protein